MFMSSQDTKISHLSLSAFFRLNKESNRFMVKTAVIVFGFLILGNLVFHWYPYDIQRTYNQSTTTEDGVRICFDVYEPMSSEPSKKAVILGHGIMVNKEVMRLMAVELANVGFVAVTLDFRGHGKSGGDFNSIAIGITENVIDEVKGEREGPGDFASFMNLTSMTADVRAIKQYLSLRGDIDMENLGYVGYSMGGGVGFLALNNDTDFKAFVGVAPLSDYLHTNLTRPPNMLIVYGQFDQAISYSDVLLVMKNRTGVAVNAIEINHLYGNFFDGSAAKLYLDPLGDHFCAGWNPNFIREMRQWMITALMDSDGLDTPFAYSILMLSFVLQVMCAIGLFTILIRPILTLILLRWKPSPERYRIVAESESRYPILYEKDASMDKDPYNQKIINALLEKGVIPEKIWKLNLKLLLYVALLGHALMVTIGPLYLSPLLITTFEIMFLFGPSMAFLLFIRRFLLKKAGLTLKDLYRSLFQSTTIKVLLAGLVLSVIFYILMVFSFGNIFGIIPAIEKLPWIPLYWAFTFLSFLNFVIYFQPLMMEIEAKRQRNTHSVENQNFSTPVVGNEHENKHDQIASENKESENKESGNEKSGTKKVDNAPPPRFNDKMRFTSICYTFLINFVVTVYILTVPSLIIGNNFLLMFLLPMVLILIAASVLGVCLSSMRLSLPIQGDKRLVYYGSNIAIPVMIISFTVCMFFMTLSPIFNIFSIVKAL
jgi:dienelactone hydrolase